MVLQNTLDLSTFEIVRFRIWNQTSQPSDRGFGSKYFNTNSGHEAYCREEIFTPSGWRTAAYLDDIEAITNGEGSLGTRVKALEDMLGLEDVTDVIDTWNDVKEFFANVDEGLDLMTMLDGKLDKTGGAISTDEATNTPLVIKSQYDGIGWVGIAYENKVGRLGGLGFKSDGTPLFVASNKVDTYTLLHSGNIGEYALKVDGSNAMTDGLQLLTMSSGSTNIAVTEGLFIYHGPSSGGTDVGLPGNYINVFNIGGINAYSNLQLAWRRDYPNPALYARIGESTNYSDWKTIAFTDSTVEAANKLADDTAYTVWGRTFFENGKPKNVSSSPIFNNNSGLYFKNAAGDANKLLFYFDTAEQLHIGRDSATDKKSTHIYGSPTYFKSSNTGQPLVTITEEGNVLVGVASQTNTDFKFEVSGLSRIYTAGQSMSLGKVPTSGLVLGSSTGLQGQFYFDYSGNFCLQGQRVSDSATRAIKLNPLGGAVNVGGNLAPNANNSLSLGASSYRWSNVYSVGGNFSGRVLIGNVNDDGTSLLQIGDESVSPLRISSSGSIVYSINLTGGWTRGIYFRNKDKNLLASISAFGNGESLSYLYIGTDAFSTSKRWFSINSEESNFNVLTNFNGGALIPTGQTLTIGSVTIKEVATGEIEVNGNLHTTGTLASGGKAEEGENTTGNAMVYQYDLASGESVYTVDNVKGSTNVIVQIFEWNGNTSSWDMILTDVSVKADAITVTFGRTTTVNHMVTVC